MPEIESIVYELGYLLFCAHKPAWLAFRACSFDRAEQRRPQPHSVPYFPPFDSSPGISRRLARPRIRLSISKMGLVKLANERLQ